MRREIMRCRRWYFRGGLVVIGGLIGLLLWMMVQTPGAQEKSSASQDADELSPATMMDASVSRYGFGAGLYGVP